jgi:DNA-binding NtrC family response regulator
VRELKNVVERAVVLSMENVIEKEHVATDKMVSHLFMPSVSRPRPKNPARVTRQPQSKRTDEPEFARITAPRKPPGDQTEPPDSIEELKDEASQEERRRILEALRRTGGNQTKAARLLGISRRTLINRLDAFNIERPRKHKGKKKD